MDEGRESSLVQRLPLIRRLQLGAAGIGIPSALPDLAEQEENTGGSHPGSRPPEVEGKSEQVDSVAVAELVAHLKDFGITTLAQIATLTDEGVHRRLGRLGSLLFQVAQC